VFVGEVSVVAEFVPPPPDDPDDPPGVRNIDSKGRIEAIGFDC
jgi:hypothetical protein